MSDKNRKVSDRYDTWTPFYDLLDNFPVISSPQKRWKRKAVKSLDLQGDERVLDVGTGTGEILPWIAEDIDEGKVIATDISRRMIDRAERRAEKEDIRDKVSIIYDNIEDSDLKKNSLDRMIATFTFTTIPHPEKAVRECARILKPDGKMIVLDTGRPRKVYGNLLFYPMMVSAKVFGRTHMDRDIPGMLSQQFSIEERNRNLIGMVYNLECTIG